MKPLAKCRLMSKIEDQYLSADFYGTSHSHVFNFKLCRLMQNPRELTPLGDSCRATWLRTFLVAFSFWNQRLKSKIKARGLIHSGCNPTDCNELG